LASGHTVNRVIDKYGGYHLTPVGGMDGFGRANGGQVSVPLIRQDELIGQKKRLTPVATARARPWGASIMSKLK
jgi:hypothetical protein